MLKYCKTCLKLNPFGKIYSVKAGGLKVSEYMSGLKEMSGLHRSLVYPGFSLDQVLIIMYQYMSSKM